MTDRSRISRNNKNRGRKFEREVAATLGWTRVPYSGAIKEWGGADVVDGFYRKGGYWAAECKTVVLHEGKPAHIDIKHKWIEQLIGGETGGRRGILVVKRIRDPKKHVGKKGLPAYVIFPEDTYDWFIDFIQMNHKISLNLIMNTYLTGLTKAKGYNFRITDTALSDLDAIDVVEYLVERDGVQDRWYVMTLDNFKEYVHNYNVMVQEHEPDE